MAEQKAIVHATSVAVAGVGLLIQGRSGSGKSGLALEMMARGAVLVADDRSILTTRSGHLWISAPASIRGMIEARGIGVLNAPPSDPVPLHAIVDMDHTEIDRLPPRRAKMLLGVSIPLLHKSASPYFAASLVHYLKCDRKE